MPPIAGVGIAYAAMSLVTLACYAWDKRQAVRGGRRVRERTLHLLALFGGWPGALVGRRLVRHKTRKLGFTVLTWMIVALHVAAWAAWAYWAEAGGSARS